MTDVPVDPTAGLRARVRLCVDRSGLTQRAFAAQIGLDPPKLSRALSGSRRFTTDELIRLAAVAGVTVNWLLSGQDTEPGDAGVSVDTPRQPARDTPEKARKRQEIITTAWRMFAVHGFQDTRLSGIAAACGVSPSILNYYFSSKRQLFEECLRYCVRRAFDRRSAELNPLDDPPHRLKHLIDLQLPLEPGVRDEWSIWLQAWYAVAVGVGSGPHHSQAYQRWYQAVHDVLRDGQQVGLFRGDSPDELAIELTGLVDGLAVRVLVGTLDAATMRAQVHRYIDRVILTDRPVPPNEGDDPR